MTSQELSLTDTRTLLFIGCGVFFVILWWIYGREKIGQTLPNPLMRRHAYTPLQIRLLWGVRIAIFLSLLLLVLDPSISLERSIREDNGKKIILTLDISNSMKADDIRPSRLERAKEVIDTFLRQDHRDMIGYVVFAGRTFLLSPLSHDRDGIRSLMRETTTDTIDQSQPDTSGTNIGDALIASIGALEGSNSGQKIIILITDGRANVGISPLQAADEAKRQNISIYTVGIGSSSGEVLSYLDTTGTRRYFYDPSGKQVLADIDETTLAEIARRTGGRYFHAENLRLLEDIFAELDTLVGSVPLYSIRTTPLSLSPFILVTLLAMMILHITISVSLRTKYKCV